MIFQPIAATTVEDNGMNRSRIPRLFKDYVLLISSEVDIALELLVSR